MIQFVVGVILGFFVATYGVSGVANALDKGISTVKNIKVTTEK